MTIFETSTAFYNKNKETHLHIHSIEPVGELLVWTPIHTEEELRLAAEKGGNFYLATDINLTRKLEITADMNLCLNDKVLKQTMNIARVFYIKDNTKFNLCDCSGENGTTRYWYKSDDGLWTLKPDGGSSDYTTTGGVITGGTKGGVYNSGTFTMYGGTITGNRAEYGGGVWNDDSGTFTMYDGSIIRNMAEWDGGGVFNHGGFFTIHNGSIEDNRANCGGGVYCRSGESFLLGGYISGNYATMFGGGVFNSEQSTLELHGGNITGNKADLLGGGIDNRGMFCIGHGTISGNTDSRTKTK